MLPVTPSASGTILPGALFQRAYPHGSIRQQIDRLMSALPPKADIGTQPRDVRFVPKAEVATIRSVELIVHAEANDVVSEMRVYVGLSAAHCGVSRDAV